jgi:hypothetical protein
MAQDINLGLVYSFTSRCPRLRSKRSERSHILAMTFCRERYSADETDDILMTQKMRCGFGEPQPLTPDSSMNESKGNVRSSVNQGYRANLP